ncbi:dual specificity phosphatase domain protein (macronuclear) [Tetrahymena thermophila SB210]|uniref:Dual specificity phosphatase domain protein n=1 Tax=Tetrahymena thermophila (strain SB210) TaxID=312017 RepID=I7MFX9_TETTS|nr:dual specificity phosphatase domain protein [Tetrahymena thermophila SB210]EAS00776.2 dual specificity phosphatase domain protein [Tetrahymena thermophila SB210]|eukprot:XP_001021021.2 dual specificity phosphatase domain protein [Tetrahymena thermophila SB210]
MLNTGLNNLQDPNKIQDQFILNCNIVKFQFTDGQIFQIKRSYVCIEALKDADEGNYEIINLVEIIKKQLFQHYNYETVKYRGRNTFSLNFLAKEKETRVIHQIAYIALKSDNPQTTQKLDSTLNKLIKMDHPNVQKIIKYSRLENSYIVFMEECIGSMQDLLIQQQNNMNQNTFLKYAGEYVNGLEYLVDKIQISSQVCQLNSLMISFNHLAIVPILIAGACEIMKEGGVYQIQELIYSINQQIYQVNSMQKQNPNSVVELYANHGILVLLLINILIPNIKNSAEKNYVTKNRQEILQKMVYFENREQILNIIIDLESYFDSNLTKQPLQSFNVSINHLKRGVKWFIRPQDLSINGIEQQTLAANFINYDFAQVSMNKYVPILDEDLINHYFLLYQQQLYQLKRKNPQLYNSENYNNSQLSISQFKEQTSPSKAAINDISSGYNSQIRIEKEIQQNYLQNIQILEDFICDNIEDFDLEDQIKLEDLKAILDSLCSNNNNIKPGFQTSNRFDNQIFQEIMEKINYKSPRLTLQIFLEAYLEYEKDLINQFQNLGYVDQFDVSLNSKLASPTFNDRNNQFIEMESPYKERFRKDSVFTKDEELQTQGNIRDIKEKMQLLHQPFQPLLNPPQKLEEIKVNKLMQEITKLQKDIDFKVEVKEEQIFKLLDSLCYNNLKQAKIDYDKKPFFKIIENVFKRNQVLNYSNFLIVYLEVCHELQSKLTNLVVQNCDIKSLDQDQLKNLVTFNNVKHFLDSIHELNYLEFNHDLKQLKIPFRRIFQKIKRSTNVNNIQKKQQNQQKEILPNFGDIYYQSQLQNQQPLIQHSYTCSIIFSVGILLGFLLLVFLFTYFIW